MNFHAENYRHTWLQPVTNTKWTESIVPISHAHINDHHQSLRSVTHGGWNGCREGGDLLNKGSDTNNSEVSFLRQRRKIRAVAMEYFEGASERLSHSSSQTYDGSNFGLFVDGLPQRGEGTFNLTDGHSSFDMVGRSFSIVFTAQSFMPGL